MRWTGRIRFLLLLPAVVWVLAFTVFPLVYSLYLAFYKIEQKVDIKREKVPLLDDQGKPVLRTMMILPIFATPLAVGYSFFTIFYEVGGPLSWTHIPFLSNPTGALFSVILVDTWQWTPFCFLVFLAALQGVPDELYEAARVDGATFLDMLKEVMLPLLMPTIVIVLLLRLAESLKLFDIPFAMTGGGPGIATQSFSLLAFRTGLRFFDLGYASAMAYALLIAVMIIITVFFRRLRETYD